MATLFESLLPMIICDVFSVLILTYLLFSENPFLTEGNTMTMPLLLSEILQMDELMGSEHPSTLVQWLSSEIKLRSALCAGMVKHPWWSPELITELRWNWPNYISSAGMI